MSTEGKHRLAAVLFADIVGYTDLSSRDEKAALKVVDELQRSAREEVEARGGRVVKFLGDAVLAVFDSANHALASALDQVRQQRVAIGLWPPQLGLRGPSDP